MAQDPAALAALFYRELEKIGTPSDVDTAHRTEACYQLLQLLFQEITRPERLVFTTHFARIAYAAHKHQLDKTLVYYLHQFRRRARGKQPTAPREATITLQLGYRVVAECIRALWETPWPDHISQLAPATWPLPQQPVKIAAFRPLLRVLVLEDDPAQEQLLARPAEQPEQTIRIQYNLPERNEYLQPTIELLRKVLGFPAVLNLLDVEVDAAGLYRPRAIVVEPDYLVDVSAVAECYRGAETDPWGYLLNRFLPYETTIPRLLGNLANFFLDELMNDPDKRFADLRSQIFALQPLAFCLFDDQQIRDLMGQAQRHFLQLKQLIAGGGLAAEGIARDDCYLEPAFYSQTYGLQGRLDLLSRPAGARSAIVELKSGKPFLPNIHGISSNHFTQTLLYDLLVRSALGAEADPAGYILYSGVDDRPLRFVPASKTQQYEALQLRNQLVAIDRLVANLGADSLDLAAAGDRLFGRLSLARYPQLKGFLRDQLYHFEQVYGALTPVERAYFAAFSGLIAREQRLAKTGIQGQDHLNGLASIWLDDPADKEQNFAWMQGLRLAVNRAKDEEPLLSLVRTARTNPLANFRVGDIAVLYPEVEGSGALLNQVFKCTVVDLDQQGVTVRLRSRQFNDRIFFEHPHWNLEHDLLDSGFTTLYRSLFAFAACPPARRALLLGVHPPRPAPDHERANWDIGLTGQQADILQRMLAAPDYFLLWGPPGTGKTSLMLHHLVRHLLAHTHEHILLLAYTNRAVDEICEAIERIGPELRDAYLRIGSRDGADPRFRDRLLQQRSAGLESRRQLIDLLQGCRIMVGTVASLNSKPELLQLKTFHRLIVDEASQVLEPGLVGLLSHFARWILIGDHRQLPAVVAQDEAASAVHDPLLLELGLLNLRDSFFERLYRRAQHQQWHWAFAQLSRQGRMHQDIMAFPSQTFYEGKLQILDETVPAHLAQTLPTDWPLPADAPSLDSILARRRLLFLPTSVDKTSVNYKTNTDEATWIARLVESAQRLYQLAGRPISAQSIGIITPYRAQIACIRQTLHERGLDQLPLTIDTVERYQGGAREMIFISLCTNQATQMASLSAISVEGIDRKLNVAMTRAREHLVILGNPALLQLSPVYQKLLAYCYAEGGWWEG